MFYVYLKGHNFKHDLFELIRALLGNNEFEFIDQFNIEKIDDSDYLIISSMENSKKASTSLYKGDRLIANSCEAIDNHTSIGYDLNRIRKQAIKRSLYDLFTSFNDSNLAWGILTGIRPMKIVHDLHDKGFSDESIYNILIDKYRISKDKVQLIIGISKLQRNYLYPIKKEKYSIYLSIPFCPSRCLYCSFPSFTMASKKEFASKYIESLISELKAVKEIMKGKELNTIYIGGGTPTALDRQDLEKIVSFIKGSFKDIKEFTVEAGRPDSIDLEKLKMLKDYQVDRISINPQTMNDPSLRFIGRNHSSKDIIESYNLAKSLDFDIINMDLILGLPGEGISHVRNTIKEIKALNPNNITVHTLALKSNSRLYSKLDNNFFDNPSEIEEIFNFTQEAMSEMNMIPYYLYRQKQILGNLENIGYSKKGKECIYNISMMEEKETIVGLGLGAISKIFYPEENRIKRVANFKDLKLYIDKLDKLIEKKEIYLNY